MKKSILIFLCLSLPISISVSSADRKSAEAKKINVVVSIFPLKDIVEQVGGEMVHADFVVPPGASPHTFEPTPSDMIRIHRARLFVIIGAGLEFWSERAIKSAGTKDLKVLVLSDGMPLIRQTSLHEEDEHDGGHTADPHIWLDPLLAKEMVDKIVSALAGLNASHKKYYMERAERYKKEIEGLDAEIAEKVRGFRTKEYVTFHSAWNYFSRRYGLRVMGVIEESPGKEASARHIAGIISEIKRTGARVVFAEPQINPKTAEVIAKEAGAKVLFLDPIGSPDIKGRDTYVGLMRYNLSMLEKAMK